MSIKQTISKPKTNRKKKQDYKGQSLYFNHIVSFEQKDHRRKLIYNGDSRCIHTLRST